MRSSLSGIGFGLVGLFFLALSVSAWLTASSWFVAISLGLFTFAVGLFALLAVWAAFTAPSPVPTAHGEGTARRQPTLAAVLDTHAAELAEVPSGERRGELLTTWRKQIDQSAKDWADQVASHPDRDSVVRAEVEAVMLAYHAGYAGGRGWIDPMSARAEAGALGHNLRDAMRTLGLALEQMSPTTGVVVDEALLSLLELGLRDGHRESR